LFVQDSYIIISILISVIKMVFGNAQACITVKTNTVSKIVAILRKVVESGRMLELSEMLA